MNDEDAEADESGDGDARPLPRGGRGRKPLSREAERELVVRAQRGDASAKDELVRHNVALVVMLARKQSRGALRLEELVQEGNLGLLRAIEKFDPRAGTRFSTYAVWWIRAYVWKYLKQARSAVRPKSGTVAASDFSLDAAASEDGDVSYLDRLEDEGPGPHEAYAAAEDAARVRGALEKVRKRIGELGWDIVHTRLQTGSARHARADRRPLGRVARAGSAGRAPDEAVPPRLSRPAA